MAAIVIILAAVIGAFVLGLGEETEEPAPVVTAELDRGITDNSPPLEGGTRKITISHEAGDTVPVSELRIITEAQCFDPSTGTTITKRGELYNLPAEEPSGPPEINNDENVRGDKIFSTRGPAIEGPIADGENWQAGESLVFHIDNDECQLLSESRTDIQIIHEPSNSVIEEKSIGSGDISIGSPANAELDISLNANSASTENFAFLNVTVIDGTFDPSLPELKMEVEVTDSAGNSVSEKEQIRDFYSISGSYTEIFKNQNQVGPGDNTALDLTNGVTGPGNFGPLDPDSGTTTDVEVTIKFKGEEIASATLEASDFEVIP
jgi:FlaG/FlaF family flagellin (archaellin)